MVDSKDSGSALLKCDGKGTMFRQFWGWSDTGI